MIPGPSEFRRPPLPREADADRGTHDVTPRELAMQTRLNSSLVFIADLGCAFITVVLLAMTLTAAEVYLTNGHMLAEAELAR